MLYTRSCEAAEAIAARAPGPIGAAVVLGSGLGAMGDRLADAVEIPYEAIPHFPQTTVAGHSGVLVVGDAGPTRTAMLRGRFHYYEGHDLSAVTFPIRVLQRLGVPTLILTAATGGIRDDLEPGAIVALSDHLNLLGANPLRGTNDDRLGERFPDMSEVYSARLRALAAAEAGRLGLPLPSGVYACMPGPCFETPAEVRMLRAMGADVVGMSTVPEAIVARHAGIEVLGLAVVTNRAAGLGAARLSHEEVLDAGRDAGRTLATLVAATLARLAGGDRPDGKRPDDPAPPGA